MSNVKSLKEQMVVGKNLVNSTDVIRVIFFQICINLVVCYNSSSLYASA